MYLLFFIQSLGDVQVKPLLNLDLSFITQSTSFVIADDESCSFSCFSLLFLSNRTHFSNRINSDVVLEKNVRLK